MLKNYLSVLIALFGVTLVIGSCTNSAKTYNTIEGVAWHTTLRITYSNATDYSDSITRVMNEVEASLSPFLADSRISRINRNEDNAADAHIVTVMTESQRINRLSTGAFDPTVAPLVNLWGFGYTDVAGEPAQHDIDSCLQLVGIADCRVEGGVMIKKHPGTQFNFSAITKGYGVDCIAEMLSRNGVEDYMVEVGGEMALKGRNSRGELWRVMIDSPDDSLASHTGLAVIEVTDCCIATSGNYRNYRETSQGRVGHTISPSTGCPVASEVLSATVIAPRAMTADALATAVMALPLSDAQSMIEQAGEGVSAMMVVATPSGGWQTVCTTGFPELH